VERRARHRLSTPGSSRRESRSTFCSRAAASNRGSKGLLSCIFPASENYEYRSRRAAR
jgi:hypothetical protein